MLLEKRGLSAVIATVLLLLITLATIAILAGVIIPFVRNTLNKSTECIDLSDTLEFDEPSDFNCYASNRNSVSIKFNPKNADSKLSALKILFISTGSSETRLINNTQSLNMLMVSSSGSLSSDLEIPQSGELRTYVYSASRNFNKAEVYPVLESGRICDISDSVALISCNPEISIIITQ